MSEQATAAVVLGAGLGTRMASRWPKVLHPLAGRPMILTLLDQVEALAPEKAVVVVGRDTVPLTQALALHTLDPLTAEQGERLGTGHAVMAARPLLDGFTGDVLILCGDVPLIRPETLAALLRRRRQPPQPAVVVLGFRPSEAGSYGRLVAGDSGALEAIVEARDAAPKELVGDLCNSGIMAVDGARLFGLLDRVMNDNAKGEYYLTDIVRLAREEGLACAYMEGDPDELIGINSRADLAVAEATLQVRLRAAAMEGGATLIDPMTVYFSFDTDLGRDVTVGPGVVFGPGVTVGDGAEIRAYSHIEGATIAAGAVVGPFARLRPGAHIGAGAHIGNFVEIKQADVGAGAKINHLSYVGDARVGPGANIGAGTITCNYDGFTKSLTEIGAGAFIGSNTALVAPVKVGDGATTGAGSVITKDVPGDALALTRAEQREIKGWAAKKSARKGQKKG